jgi:hypothetical protein
MLISSLWLRYANWRRPGLLEHVVQTMKTIKIILLLPVAIVGVVFMLVVILAVLGCWSAAKQEKNNVESDKISAEMRSDIGLIKNAMGIKASPSTTEVTPQAILDTLDAQRKAIVSATLHNFAFFKLADDVKDVSGKVTLRLDASGPVLTLNYWISNASAKRNANDPAYWSVDQRKPLIPVVYPNTEDIERLLSPGDYIIEFDALNGHWVEYLSIYLEDGKIKQKIRVTNSKGELLYEAM